MTESNHVNAMAERSGSTHFEIPDDLVYLNCASLAPRLKAVSAAGRAALDRMAAPWTVRSPDWFRDARTLSSQFARLIGAPPECATLVPSVSYGVAVAARNVPLGAGENVVVIDQEYPSNFYSWRRLADERGAAIRSVRPELGVSLTEAVVNAIDRDTSVVAVANCRWTDGHLVNLQRIGQAVRRNNAALVIDASQSLGAYPLDVDECRPDFIVGVGYKWLLGPYGLGYLYASERWHADGEPLEESWLHRAGSDNFAALVDYTPYYKPGAERFGQGESAQFYLLPMAIAALSQLTAWTPEYVNRQLRAWTEELVSRAELLGFTAPPPEHRAGHMVGLSLARGLRPDFVSALAERGIYVSVRGSCIRVAPHLHSGGDALDRLIAALRDLSR